MTSRSGGAGSPIGRGRPAADAGQGLDRFVAGFEWSVPTRIEVVDRGWLENEPGDLAGRAILRYSSSAPARRVRPGPGLLADFLQLCTASDQAILAYARRWGPLWLCPAHNLPWRHDASCQPSPAVLTPDDSDAPARDAPESADLKDQQPVEDGRWFAERLSSWRAFSGQAQATVRLARRLRDGQLGRPADWDALPFLPRIVSRVLGPALPDPLAAAADSTTRAQMPRVDAELTVQSGLPATSSDADPAGDPLAEQADHEAADERSRRVLLPMGTTRWESSIDVQRQVFGEVMNYWLEMARVQPHVDWTSDRPAMQLRGDGLVGAVAVQLLFDCAHTGGLAVCTSCGLPFLPGPRRPRRDRNVYCSDCGLKAAARDAAARYRQTEKYRATYETWLQKRSRPSTYGQSGN